jgi:hypothetical protein
LSSTSNLNLLFAVMKRPGRATAQNALIRASVTQGLAQPH